MVNVCCVSARTPLSGPPKAAQGYGLGLGGTGTRSPDACAGWARILKPKLDREQVGASWGSRESA